MLTPAITQPCTSAGPLPSRTPTSSARSSRSSLERAKKKLTEILSPVWFVGSYQQFEEARNALPGHGLDLRLRQPTTAGRNFSASVILLDVATSGPTQHDLSFLASAESPVLALCDEGCAKALLDAGATDVVTRPLDWTIVGHRVVDLQSTLGDDERVRQPETA